MKRFLFRTIFIEFGLRGKFRVIRIQWDLKKLFELRENSDHTEMSVCVNIIHPTDVLPYWGIFLLWFDHRPQNVLNPNPDRTHNPTPVSHTDSTGNVKQSECHVHRGCLLSSRWHQDGAAQWRHGSACCCILVRNARLYKILWGYSCTHQESYHICQSETVVWQLFTEQVTCEAFQSGDEQLFKAAL